MRVPVGDIALNVETFEAAGQRRTTSALAGRQPLVLLHGFTGRASAWAPCAERLRERWALYAVDQPGHGDSDAPHDPSRYALERFGDDLAGLLDALEIDRAHVLGYSMGGRAALAFAVAHRHRILSLIIESASPGIRGDDERRERVLVDRRLAELLDNSGIATFVERWERAPLFASQRHLPTEQRRRQREQRLAANPHGLANSLRGAGAGAMTPLWSSLPTLEVPALVIVGQLDEKYRDIGRATADRLPRARLVEVPSAGHNVHLDRPSAFFDELTSFLDAVTRDTVTSTTHPRSIT